MHGVSSIQRGSFTLAIADERACIGQACYPRSTFYLLSDGLSIQHRRITKSCFRTCSSHGTRSQAPLYLYARNPIADRVEGTFELLRYRLGGDRPSQTAHLALSAARIHGTGLEFKHNQGGVSLAGSPRTGILGSKPPTYATQAGPKPNTKLQ